MTRPATPTGFTVRPLLNPLEFDLAFAVRRAVFIEEQRVPEAIERDEYDIESDHVIALDGDRAVGTGRLAVIHGVPRIGRMAVLASHRGQGLGQALMRALLTIASVHGYREVHLAAQLPVEAFYAKLGFASYGEVFEEAGIQHRMMKQRLS